MEKNIIVKLFLDLLLDERDDPLDPPSDIFLTSDTEDRKFYGMTSFVHKRPFAVHIVMEEMNLAGISNEAIVSSFIDFTEEWERERDESFAYRYRLLVHIKDHLLMMQFKDKLPDWCQKDDVPKIEKDGTSLTLTQAEAQAIIRYICSEIENVPSVFREWLKENELYMGAKETMILLTRQAMNEKNN